MVNHPNRRRKLATAATPHSVPATHDHDYSDLLKVVRKTFSDETLAVERLFTTDATGLFDLFLAKLPREIRQIHNCHACRRFVETYGNLVKIEADYTVPVMWKDDDTSPPYKEAVAALEHRVAVARVNGVFYASSRVWGTPITGSWKHMAVEPDPRFVHKYRLKTPAQEMARMLERHRLVCVALGDLKPEILDEALRILETGSSLYRADMFVAPVRWLRQLHDRPKGWAGHNVIWAAVAAAPEGYCHPRSSVIGSLLEDIEAGRPFPEIKARFEAKVHPAQYQRPQAAPAAGNIRRAEEVVVKLGIERSLQRRFARIDDLQGIIWLPTGLKDASKPSGGVFGHLKPKTAPATGAMDLLLPEVTMTWVKFRSTVLHSAERIEQVIGPGSGKFIGLTTAAHEDAPPILKWDHEGMRNPVSWYVYLNRSLPSRWGLSVGQSVEVTAITTLPSMWGSSPMPHLGEGVVLVLKGAVDKSLKSNPLFPEQLKSELHEVRSTIEAFARTSMIHGRDRASACGFDVRANAPIDAHLRVLSSGRWQRYKIDRWD